MQSIDEALAKLEKSKFRSSFHLKKADIEYIDKKGMDTVKRHAAEIISKRLAPAVIANDGAQTPTHGHPVFVAQHACACCCRGCLEKWYKVPRKTELTKTQQEKTVALLCEWISREYNSYREKNNGKEN